MRDERIRKIQNSSFITHRQEAVGNFKNRQAAVDNRQ